MSDLDSGAAPSLFASLGSRADANGDGQFTISDVGAWLGDLAVLPGDLALTWLLDHAAPVAAFFELGTADRGGPFVIWASIMLWLAALLVASIALNAVRELDRNVTAYVAGRYAETRRQFRVLRRRAAGFILRWRSERAARAESIAVDDVVLNRLEIAVLRVLTNLDDGAVISRERLAQRLHQRESDVDIVLRRLDELAFVERGRDAICKAEGLRITSAGQMYLVAR